MKLYVLAIFAILCLSTNIAAAESSPSPHQAGPGFPQKDGMFSAMLIVIPEQDLKQFDKAVDERVQLRALSKVKRQENFAIKIGFSGLAQDVDQKADITFDFKVIKPDGTMMGEEKNLPALQGKIVNPFFLYDTKTEIIMSFEDTDKSGTYKIIAEIRDNIGKKHIALEKEITLVD